MKKKQSVPNFVMPKRYFWVALFLVALGACSHSHFSRLPADQGDQVPSAWPGDDLKCPGLFTSQRPVVEESPFHVLVQETEQSVQVINNGLADFQKRREMLRSAKKSISYEAYLFKNDRVGRAILHEMVQLQSKRKAEGLAPLSIRILTDYYNDAGYPFLDSYLGQALRDHGIELRYYNPGVVGPGNLYRVNFRDHRKMIVVDSEQVLVGGRNTAEAYFEFSPDYNYQDRDLWASGPVAEVAEKSFDAYWNDSNWVAAVPAPEDPSASDTGVFSGDPHRDGAIRSYRNARKKAENFVNPDPKSKGNRDFFNFLKNAESKGVEILASIPVFDHVGKIKLVTDSPDHLTNRADRFVSPFLDEELKKAQKTVIENWSMTLARSRQEILNRNARKPGNQILILANGLKTPEPDDLSGPVAFQLARYVEVDLLNAGSKHSTVKVLDVSGHPLAGDPLLDPSLESVLTGTHAKTEVIEYPDPSNLSHMAKDTVIGSHNMDIRSYDTDNEIVIAVMDDARVADYTVANIEKRIAGAVAVLPDGTYANGSDPYAAMSEAQLGRIRFAEQVLFPDIYGGLAVHPPGMANSPSAKDAPKYELFPNKCGIEAAAYWLF